MFNKIIRAARAAIFASALGVSAGAPPAAAQSVVDFIDSGTFVFDFNGTVAQLLPGAAEGERTNVVCIADNGSSLGGFAAVQFIENATGNIVSLGVTTEECALNNDDDGGGDDGGGGDQGQDDDGQDGDDVAGGGLPAGQAMSAVDGNLNDFFPENFNGDLFGAFGINNVAFAGVEGRLCDRCKGELDKLRARLAEVRGQLDQLNADRDGLISRNEATLARFGIGTLDEIRANDPRAGDLSAALNGKDKLSRALADLRAANPQLNEGGASVADIDALSDETVSSQARLNLLTQSLRSANDDGERASVAFAASVGRFLGSVGATIASGGALGPAAVVDFVNLALDIAELGQLANEANSLEAQIAAERANQNLISAIVALDTAARLIREGIEKRAAEEQQAKIDAALAGIEPEIRKLEGFVTELLSLIARKEEECELRCAAARQANLGGGGGGAAFANAGGFAIAAKRNTLAASFDLSQYRSRRAAKTEGDGDPLIDLPGLLGDSRFNVFASSSVTISDDSRPNGQDGVSFDISAGFSYRVTPEVALGLAGRFSDTDVDGATGRLDGQTFSIAAFAQTSVGDGFNIDGILSYSNADIDATFLNGGVQTTADIDADSFAAQLKASKTFSLARFALTPSVSLTYSTTDRDPFRISDGQAVAGFSDDNLTASGGVALSTQFVSDDGAWTISPSASVGGFGSLTDGGGGASVGAGVNIRSASGVAVGLNAGFSGFNSGQDNYSLGATVSVPLN